MYTKIITVGILVTGLLACNGNKEAERSVEEIITDDKISNADIIRNEASAKQPLDTVNVAKLQFEEEIYNFGKIKAGVIVDHSFKFTNVGKVPLIISDARTTCGCTAPDWPKDPIKPGEKGIIAVKFDSNGKSGLQNKPITIVANSYPANTVVYLEGEVILGETNKNTEQ